MPTATDENAGSGTNSVSFTAPSGSIEMTGAAGPAMSPGLRMMSSMRPAAGASSVRFDSRQRACSSACSACLTWLSAALIVSGRAGSPATARLASAWPIAAWATSTAVIASSSCACVAMPRLNRSCDARQHPPLLVGLRVGRAHRGLQHLDLLGSLADLQVGELRLGLRKRRLGLQDGDLGIAAFQLGDHAAGLDAVAAPDRDRLHLRHLDRRQQHVVAFDIADGERRRRHAGRKQRRDQRDGTDEAHDFRPLRAARIAARLSIATAATAFASFGPISAQPMRLQHRLAADAEVDDLADQREHGDLGALALGRLAGRRRPDPAELAVHRLEHALVDAVERGTRLRQLAQHELGDLAGLRACHEERHHALDRGRQARAAASGVLRRRSLRQGRPRNALHRLDDEVGAGRVQPLLAAEMIGDRADIGLGKGGDLARRGAVEALPAEQLQPGMDQGSARLVGGR